MSLNRNDYPTGYTKNKYHSKHTHGVGGCGNGYARQHATVFVGTNTLVQATVEIEAFKEQIENLFSQFESFLFIRAQNNQKKTVRVNQMIAQNLNLFSSTCEEYRKLKNEDALIAGFAHFEQLTSQFPVAGEIESVQDFLSHMQASLTSKRKQKMIPLLRSTVKAMSKALNRESGRTFAQNLLHENHVSNDKEKCWKANAPNLHKNQRKSIQQHKKKFKQQAQRTSNVKPENMFRASGIANPKFGVAIDPYATKQMEDSLYGPPSVAAPVPDEQLTNTLIQGSKRSYVADDDCEMGDNINK